MVAEAREGRMLRRGLPRVAGGDPWPPEIALPAGEGDVDDAVAAMPVHAEPDGVETIAGAAGVTSGAGAAELRVDAAEPRVDAVAPEVDRSAAGADAAAGAASSGAAEPGVAENAGVQRVRRGLPRTPGGEPWPPADAAVALAAGAEPATGAGASAAHGGTVDEGDVSKAPASATPAASDVPAVIAPGAVAADGVAVSAPAAASANAHAASGPTSGIRRGLPRAQGGEPWPPADTVPADTVHTASSPVAAADHEHEQAPAPAQPAPVPPASPAPASTSEPVPAEAPPAAAASTAVAPSGSVLARDLATPLAVPRTVWDGRAPRRIPAAPAASAAASARPRPTWTQGIAVLFGAAALGVLAGAAVALVRALLSLPALQDFLATYPGEYAPAVTVEPGFAPWVGWQHFFNAFLMVLIIRSGLRIRHEKRPTAFWAPRNNPKGKTSLTIWFHQALDVLWLVNGVIFVVLLFVTGHWARIVPTSWEVIPNALSAALQYVSFDWPHENGWNNYNSLQQLAYFVTVFIAAPLAAITGFRMSGMWPKKAERLSRAYPVEWARKLHFPVMIYFVIFIVAHVALVMLTGFLRNLNHMYAAQDAVTWTGFGVFIASLVVMAVGWAAARPLVIAPIARVFGNVSGR
ncbi:cytochrome b/b6 domain-containing protein [uncultured Microbacterium sp.]|uniref:cytochrome b/b6 domain-containing protein n=1 Tax=uncultured Microbacterium sp. TaxID=191216 RepID=UPI0028DC4413|nr:cytochrome b/b6 domain-containing protein [uncultured Microbacterium sp.]